MNVHIPIWLIIIFDILTAVALWMLVGKTAFGIYAALILISWTTWFMRFKAEKDKLKSQTTSKCISKHDMSEQ